jgi:hypothetical protein
MSESIKAISPRHQKGLMSEGILRNASGTKHSTPNIRLVSDSNRNKRESLILVDAGNYQVTLVKAWKDVLFGKSQKLFLSFRIVTEGKFYGQHITHCYNIKGINKHGAIIPKGTDSKFVVEYSHLFGEPKNLADVGIRSFKGKIFNCSVRTIDKDFKQQPTPADRHYSVIERLTDVVVNTTEEVA